MDGLDLIVGAIISATVAGLGAAVAAYFAPFVSRSVRSIAMVAWVTGGVFIFGSYLTISNIPDRADLIALVPSVVHEAYVDKSINGDMLRLFDAQGGSVTVNPRKDYYQDLVAAIDSGQSYRVLYARERGLFSNDRKAYIVIYDVSVNGETLESFESRVNQLRLFCSGTFAFGLVMLVGGFLVPGRSTRALPPLVNHAGERLP